MFLWTDYRLDGEPLRIFGDIKMVRAILPSIKTKLLLAIKMLAEVILISIKYYIFVWEDFREGIKTIYGQIRFQFQLSFSKLSAKRN